MAERLRAPDSSSGSSVHPSVVLSPGRDYYCCVLWMEQKAVVPCAMYFLLFKHVKRLRLGLDTTLNMIECIANLRPFMPTNVVLLSTLQRSNEAGGAK